uniref:BacB protein n=1 Tax=Enterococcus faecalis TaxID=1351 RepID=O52964_ENTFL|nr:bacB [Enterococcus faecalis]
MNLFGILMKLRINQESSLVKRVLSYFNLKLSLKLYLFINIFFEFSLAFVVSLGLRLTLIKSDINVNLFFIIFFILGIVQGASNCYRTHVFPFEELRKLATISSRKISFIMIVTDLFYIFMFSSSILYGLLSLIYISSNAFIFQKISLSVFFLFIYICSFYCSNRIFGQYIYNKIVKAIGLTRLILYSIGAALFTYFGFFIVSFVFSNIVYFIKKYFVNIESVNNKVIWESFSKDIGMFYVNSASKFYESHVYSFTYIDVFLVSAMLLILAILLLAMEPKLYPLKTKMLPKTKIDLCNLYVFFLNKALKKNIFFKCSLLKLANTRWIIANNFFQNIILTYESFFYIGVMLSIILLNSQNRMLQIQLLFLLNILVIGNQTFEIREEMYPYLSFGSERNQFTLLRSSPNGLNKVFNSKLTIYRLFLLIPLLILIIINIVVSVYIMIPVIFAIFLFITFSMSVYVFPMIQMYMIPLATKLDYTNDTEIGSAKDEKIVLEKFQTVPRYFFNIVPLVLTFIFPIVGESYSLIIFFGELVYFSLATIIFVFFSKKIIRKGIFVVHAIRYH